MSTQIHLVHYLNSSFLTVVTLFSFCKKKGYPLSLVSKPNQKITDEMKQHLILVHIIVAKIIPGMCIQILLIDAAQKVAGKKAIA
jgi:hypothetical protein